MSNQTEKWNTDGRTYITQLNKVIAKARAGKNPEEWPKDPRTAEEAQTAIALAEKEYREGHWNAANPIVDRAHEPFVGMLNDVCQSLSCVTILGADEFLVRQGTAYQAGTALHFRGGEVTERPDILAVARSRNRQWLLLAQEQGFSLKKSLFADPTTIFPWPEGQKPTAIDILQVSDDGRTIAFVAFDSLVWLGQAGEDETTWTCVYPSLALMEEIIGDQNEEDEEHEEHEEDEEDEDGENAGWDSMMHCALSPDGKFIAYGSQSFGHFIAQIDGIGSVKKWATIGSQSEYPHFACFSDDSEFVALNSCHFYNGATVCCRIADIEGAETEPYEEDNRTPIIDEELRVYAATWLPSGFALAGADYLNIVTADGSQLSATYFGSTACSIDYCPEAGLLAVASYSGFLHIFAPSQLAEEGKTIGHRPIREVYRWVLWRDRPPFRW